MFTNLFPFAAIFGLAAIAAPLLEHAGDAGGGGAPAGGGAPPAADAADPAQGDPAGAAAEAGAEHVDTGEDHDPGGDDDADDDAFVNGLPEANLRTRVRRGQRFRREAEPIVNLLRDPSTGKLYPAEHVTRVLNNAREFEGLDRVLRSDPELVQAFMKAEARLRNGGQPAADDEHPPFDEAAFEKNYRYEIDTELGRHEFDERKAVAKELHELKGQNKRLLKAITGVQQGTQRQAFEKMENESKALALEASKDIDPAYHQGFFTSCGTHFRYLQASGRATPQAMKAFIDNWVAPVRAVKQKQTRSTASRQSAMAAGNGNLPRVPRPGTVQPATGETPKRETLKDASKSFLSRYAG